ncbi:MAG: DUF5063 domain-containing protein [Bacteroidales bacterium]|nr:DUF5063 domain-containing protein [Bacteroidales bacterium]
MEQIPNHPVYSKGVLELLTVANEFCLFSEKANELERHDVLSFFQKICPLLYIKGALLPVVEPEFPEANERFVNEHHYEEIFNKFRECFGSDDEYYSYDPIHFDSEELRKSSLSENLSDVYQDLKDFLYLYQKNSLAAKECAVSECLRLFEMHWGIRITNATTAIHNILYRDKREAFDYESTLD